MKFVSPILKVGVVVAVIAAAVLVGQAEPPVPAPSDDVPALPPIPPPPPARSLARPRPATTNAIAAMPSNGFRTSPDTNRVSIAVVPQPGPITPQRATARPPAPMPLGGSPQRSIAARDIAAADYARRMQAIAAMQSNRAAFPQRPAGFAAYGGSNSIAQPPVNPYSQPAQASPLVWEAVSKEVHAQPGETNVVITYVFTNTAPTEVSITAVRPSCGCTVAKIPPLPWRIAPGATDKLEIVADLRGKRGALHKMISVDTSVGMRLLAMTVHIPEGSVDSRARNQMLAMANRQSVFRGDCASCHVQPAIGKKGYELYAAACGVCHEAEHRASMVPDLRTVKGPQNREYWQMWVSSGKPGTLMPAFSKAEGGPLTDEQLHSLVDFLTHSFPPRQTVQATTPYHDD